MSPSTAWIGIISSTLVLGLLGDGRAAETPPLNHAKPNVVVLLADDLGYGDVGCYCATHIKTPNIDRLAAQGMRISDAHAPAATCQPSRYGLLTGRYHWREHSDVGPS
jgi:arylsulfatase A-like enzyme